ncbi:hypothetical protein QQF64_001958 [Cirrhinus molitorella]|uniref:RGS domain-containing protein n=1 Tax=Cirrhinus molitorella TaxID=172907 RepID=A0ABR3MNT0_9TELE
MSICLPQSVSGVEMWKRKQRRVGLTSQLPGQPMPNTCFLCRCGCCKCPWNEGRMERSERQTCTKIESIKETGEQHPALDEMVDWSQSLEVMLQSPVGRDLFQKFLKSEYSEENLMFWIACEELKKETKPSTIVKKARKIYEDYISVFSPKEVNLDSQIRNDIEQSLKEPSSMMYEEAQLQIVNLMRRDCFHRFLNSPIYRDCLNSKNQKALTLI